MGKRIAFRSVLLLALITVARGQYFDLLQGIQQLLQPYQQQNPYLTQVNDATKRPSTHRQTNRHENKKKTEENNNSHLKKQPASQYDYIFSTTPKPSKKTRPNSSHSNSRNNNKSNNNNRHESSITFNDNLTPRYESTTKPKNRKTSTTTSNLYALNYNNKDVYNMNRPTTESNIYNNRRPSQKNNYEVISSITENVFDNNNRNENYGINYDSPVNIYENQRRPNNYNNNAVVTNNGNNNGLSVTPNNNNRNPYNNNGANANNFGPSFSSTENSFGNVDYNRPNSGSSSFGNNSHRGSDGVTSNNRGISNNDSRWNTNNNNRGTPNNGYNNRENTDNRGTINDKGNTYNNWNTNANGNSNNRGTTTNISGASNHRTTTSNYGVNSNNRGTTNNNRGTSYNKGTYDNKGYVTYPDNPLINRPGVKPAPVDIGAPPITNRPVTQNPFSFGSSGYEGNSEPDILLGPDEDDMSEAQKRRYVEMSEKMCDRYKALNVKKVVALPLVPSPNPVEVNVTECTPLNVPLVIGGKVVTINEFPHMALVGWKKTTTPGYSWKCGGSLISNLYILTAGHCTYQDKDYDAVSGPPHAVQLGSSYLDDPGALVVKVAAVIRHPKYKQRRSYHDIAMIQMVNKVTFSEVIRPACLGVPPPVGRNVIATGWGRTEFGGDHSLELRSVSLPIWDMRSCREIWGTSLKLPQGVTPDSHVCAGDKRGGKDTCQGDSGGPAQLADGCAWRVVAVTSFGRSCGAPGTPALYAVIPRAFVAAQIFENKAF